MRKIAIVILLCIGVTSCQSNRSQNQYGFLKRKGLDQEEYLAAREGLSIDFVRVSSGGGMGAKCRVDITLNRDGTASKKVENYDPRSQEEFVGTVDLWDFGRLCQLVDKCGFSRFKESYDDGRTDSGGLFVAVKYRNEGSEKQVWALSDLAPEQLWVLTKTTEGIAAGIKWKKNSGVQSR